MRHVPEICISLCGAAALVAVALWPALRRLRRRVYVTAAGRVE